MILLVLGGFVIGAILGSFVKVVAERSILQTSIKGRSYCPQCKKTLLWYDLFPVFSYLWLLGKCRYCKKKIPLDDFIFETLFGIFVAAVFIIFLPQDLNIFLSPTLQSGVLLLDTAFKIFFIAVLSIIFIIDLKTGLIPDRIIFPATLITALYILITFSIRSWDFYHTLTLNPFGKYLLPPYSNFFVDNLLRLWTGAFWSLISAIAAASLFILLIVITKGKGMGWGDVKYVFFLGLALGFPNIAISLFLAFFVGAIVSLVLVASSKKRFGQTIPFGPFLSLGAFIALLYGISIINFYLSFSTNLVPIF